AQERAGGAGGEGPSAPHPQRERRRLGEGDPDRSTDRRADGRRQPDRRQLRDGVVTRRSFVQSAALAAAGVRSGASSAFAAGAVQRRPKLVDRFTDLRRHFLFEYYPWYRNDPWEHWPEGGHHPPADFGSNFVPALGLYDSRSTAVMERHARWIADSGAGAIDVSWWGPDSNVNEVIPTRMDVMAAHDIHVTFYIEPYTAEHAQNYARDILYLIRNYGD